MVIRVLLVVVRHSLFYYGCSVFCVVVMVLLVIVRVLCSC